MWFSAAHVSDARWWHFQSCHLRCKLQKSHIQKAIRCCSNKDIPSIFQWHISYMFLMLFLHPKWASNTSNNLHPTVLHRFGGRMVMGCFYGVSWIAVMNWLGMKSLRSSQNDINWPHLLRFRIYRVKSGQFGEAPNGLDDMMVGTSMEFQCCKFWALLETPFSSSTYLANEGELWGPPKIRNRNRSWSCYIITLRETNINNLFF